MEPASQTVTVQLAIEAPQPLPEVIMLQREIIDAEQLASKVTRPRERAGRDRRTAIGEQRGEFGQAGRARAPALRNGVRTLEQGLRQKREQLDERNARIAVVAVDPAGRL